MSQSQPNVPPQEMDQQNLLCQGRLTLLVNFKKRRDSNRGSHHLSPNIAMQNRIEVGANQRLWHSILFVWVVGGFFYFVVRRSKRMWCDFKVLGVVPGTATAWKRPDGRYRYEKDILITYHSGIRNMLHDVTTSKHHHRRHTDPP
jgi:hypothetical protein